MNEDKHAWMKEWEKYWINVLMCKQINGLMRGRGLQSRRIQMKEGAAEESDRYEEWRLESDGEIEDKMAQDRDGMR